MSKSRKAVEKIINILLNVVLVVFGIILIISIYNNIQIHIMGNSYSSFFGYSTFEVQTGSMKDEIDIGDWIIVKSTKDIKLDDIITYEKDGEYITHRVIEAYKGTYKTKGDANPSADDAITSEQVVGKVVKILPNFGVIRKVLLNPAVLFAMVVTLYLIGYALRGGKKSKIKKEAPEEKVEVQKIEKEDNIENDILSQEDLELIENELDIDEDDKTEEIEKTMYFRMISVDKDEYNSSKVKVKIDDDDEKPKKKVKKENKEEVKENPLIGKNKKFKNIIDKVMFLKKKELQEIIECLNNYETYKTNEKQIKDELLQAYVELRYNNEVEISRRKLLTEINSKIKAKGIEITKSYKGKDNLYEQKVNKFVSILSIVNYLEVTYNILSKIGEKREAYFAKIKKELNKDLLDTELKVMVNNIIKVQKDYDNAIKESIKGQKTNIFELTYTKISKDNNYFKVDLNHNIEFSNLYSDYIVDKTYKEGTIAEDKMPILTNLLLIKVIEDMFDPTMNGKYFINIPNTMYEKANKLNKVLDLIKDDYSKNNVILLIDYGILSKNKKMVKTLKKEGYRFASFVEDVKVIKELDSKALVLVDYLFLPKIKNVANIPEDLKEKLVEIGGSNK